ncbi:SRPBCC family protein [Mycobacterium aquaticum]|uniref:Cyclase n=1 Tax=Mycobacterium aquaticum TaxID=1927124 RepID=A0A1X0AN53_9MYCO|nr:SRPBCC family protein [Mycobacterium aquaticum]ORA31479.1 cyclase [Mycobacterium aquaticum]
MPLVSKTVEVDAPAETIMAIVADFEAYPQWNPEIKGCWILARYDDGRPSQLRLDVEIQGQAGVFITAVYYPAENQIYTVLQQGDHFSKQEQRFSVVPLGASTLLQVDMEVEVDTKLPIPSLMVKKLIGDTLDHLANALIGRAQQLSA